jgi:glutamate synthase (NADPH/NADH) small chain
VLNHDGDRPVSIARLQRYATDSRLMHGRAEGEAPAAIGGKVAVIGAGPSGLACASVLRSLGLSVTVFDARTAVGGLVRYAIAPYRLWASPLDEEAQQLVARGVEFQLGRAIDGPEALKALESEYDAIYLGVGLGEDTMLDLPGKNLPGVHAALPWIEALKAGEMPPLGERVAVIGGGNTAIDVAREAMRLGAREVTMLYRRTQAEMPAYGFEVEEAAEEGVRFLWLTIPVSYVGKGHVEGVTCRYARLSEPDESGRRRPEEVPGTDFVFPCDTVITALGQNPRKTFLGWIEGLELRGGRIAVDPTTGQTGNPKYYAGGDAVNGGATAVEAVREAKRAALAIARRLEEVRA